MLSSGVVVVQHWACAPDQAFFLGPSRIMASQEMCDRILAAPELVMVEGVTVLVCDRAVALEKIAAKEE